MRKAIIDIDSNTICIEAYDIYIDKSYKRILGEKYNTNIVEYVEKDTLTDEGINKLIYTFEALQDLCRLIGCNDIDCFAADPLRRIKNLNEVKITIKNIFDWDINILSEYDEALYDYYAITTDKDIKSGIGFNLGGNHCQIFTFDDGIKVHSIHPVGSMLMYKSFVGRNHLMPTKKQSVKIKKYVKECMKTNNDIKDCGYDTIYAIGGSAQAVHKFYCAVMHSTSPVLTVKQLSDFLDKIYGMGGKAASLMCREIPERIPSAIPALISIIAVCRYTGVKKIRILDKSIRDGYASQMLNV